MTLSPDSYTEHTNTWRTTQSQRRECKAAVQCVGSDQTTWMSNFSREARLTGLWLVSEHSDMLLENRLPESGGAVSPSSARLFHTPTCWHASVNRPVGGDWLFMSSSGRFCIFPLEWIQKELIGLARPPVTKAAYFHRVTVCSMYID